MNDSDTRRLRAAIETEQGRVAEQIANLQQSFVAIVDAAELTSTDDEHDPEGTTIAYERAQVSALLHQARADLDDLVASLARIDSGIAATCATCGGQIPLERVLALPAVQTCIRCAS